MVIVADIETDSLRPERVWCLCTKDTDTGEEKSWSDHEGVAVDGSLFEGCRLLEEADTIVMHNGIGFDLYWLAQLHHLHIDPSKVVDTLLLSRMLRKEKIGNSLKEWGERLGFPKGEFSDFGAYSETMLAYCQQDVRVTEKVYQTLFSKLDDDVDVENVLRLEQQFNFATTIMTEGGVRLDVEYAMKVRDHLKKLKQELYDEFQKEFPPTIEKRVSAKTGKPLKDKVVEFNPESSVMVSELLVSKCGYKAKRRTKTGKPAVDEEALATIDHKYAKMLLKWRKLVKLLNSLENEKRGTGLLNVVHSDKKIRHYLNSMSAITSRCGHSAPNMTTLDSSYKPIRKCIVPDEGHLMVGADASELELRILSHFLHSRDKGEYAEKIINGDKSIGTDAHSCTAKVFGISRDDAKSLVYAFNYGAGDWKLVSMMKSAGSPIITPAGIRAKMNEAVVGIIPLIEQVKQTFTERGYIRTMAGRRIPKPVDKQGKFAPHMALNYLIQSNGSEIMKEALNIFHFDIAVERGLVHGHSLQPIGFRYLLNVHDEQQFSAEPDVADKVGKAFVEAIKESGRRLGCRCPMDGEYKVGNNWSETH